MDQALNIADIAEEVAFVNNLGFHEAAVIRATDDPFVIGEEHRD